MTIILLPVALCQRNRVIKLPLDGPLSSIADFPLPYMVATSQEMTFKKVVVVY